MPSEENAPHPDLAGRFLRNVKNGSEAAGPRRLSGRRNFLAHPVLAMYDLVPSGRTFMETDLRAASTVVDAQSAMSWGAIAAGAVGAAALALLLIAFGAGLGLSAVSPWSDSGVSASTFNTGTGIYLVIVAVMSSAVGGYLAARLRTKWVGAHTNEIFFRDTAHGFLAWAFADAAERKRLKLCHGVSCERYRGGAGRCSIAGDSIRQSG